MYVDHYRNKIMCKYFGIIFKDNMVALLLLLVLIPTLEAADNSSTTRAVPSVIELFLPSYLLLGFGILLMTAVILWSMYDAMGGRRRKARVSSERWEMAVVTDSGYPGKNQSSKVFMDDTAMKGKDVRNIHKFLGKFDKEVLHKIPYLHLQPSELIRICVPAICTISLGPVFMFGYYSILHLFWSIEEYPSLPNINQGVACFLTPAGLVYAISFGFAFQQAITKQNEILEKMTNEISYLDQAATLTSKLKLRSAAIKVDMYRALKAEALFMVLQIQKGDLAQYRHRPEENLKVEIWKIVDHLQTLASGRQHYVDVFMSQKIIDYISALNSVCSDQLGILHSKIHWLKWLFLMTLGFFSLFGVLMIQAFSYRMELMMSTLTLVSIGMLCYIVADLDSPFTGFFRIDVRIISDVIYRLEMLSKMTDLGCTETACYPDSSKFRHKR